METQIDTSHENFGCEFHDAVYILYIYIYIYIQDISIH